MTENPDHPKSGSQRVLHITLPEVLERLLLDDRVSPEETKLGFDEDGRLTITWRKYSDRDHR